MTAIEIKFGDVFGLLTTVREVQKVYQPSGQYQRAFLCKCKCGREKKIRLSHLRTGRVSSCGCLSGDQHGLSRSKLYKAWRAMVYRCKPNYFQKHLYYEKNITVCEQWLKFISFQKWANDNNYEEGLQLDRIDNNKGYSPENCRFVDQRTNMGNRSITIKIIYNGSLMPFSQVLHSKGLLYHYKTIRERIKRGWRPQRAIDTPIRKGNYKRNKDNFFQIIVK